MNPEQFVRVLEGIVTADNALRNHAEQTYLSFLENNPDLCLRYLIEVARAPSLDTYIKELALVLFRRVTIAQENSVIHKIGHERYIIHHTMHNDNEIIFISFFTSL